MGSGSWRRQQLLRLSPGSSAMGMEFGQVHEGAQKTMQVGAGMGAGEGVG